MKKEDHFYFRISLGVFFRVHVDDTVLYFSLLCVYICQEVCSFEGEIVLSFSLFCMGVCVRL